MNLISTSEAAKHFGRSRRALSKAAAKGLVSHLVRVGNYYFAPLESWDAYINGERAGSTGHSGMITATEAVAITGKTAHTNAQAATRGAVPGAVSISRRWMATPDAWRAYANSGKKIKKYPDPVKP